MFLSRDRKNTVGTAVISGSVVLLFMCDFVEESENEQSQTGKKIKIFL